MGKQQWHKEHPDSSQCHPIPCVSVCVCVGMGMGGWLSLGGVRAPHWLPCRGQAEVRTCVMDGPVSPSRLSSSGPQPFHAVLRCSRRLTPLCQQSDGVDGEKRSSEKMEDNSLRWVHQWTFAQPLCSISASLTSSHMFFQSSLTLAHTHTLTHWLTSWCHLSQLLSPLRLLPPSRCQSLYRLGCSIGTRWCTSVNGGIHFGCQSKQGRGQWAPTCQYLNGPDERVPREGEKVQTPDRVRVQCSHVSR